MFRKYLVCFTLLFLAWGNNALAKQVDLSNPYVMVKEVASQTFERIKKQQAEIKKNPDEMKQIVKQELMPYIDTKFSALKVLGRYFQKYPRKEIYQYIDVFRQYIIATYANALTYYNDQTIQFEPAKDFSNERQVSVKAIIKSKDQPDIHLTFIVRKERNGNWRAYDMVAEGISLLSSKQNEFEPILRQDGLQAIIDKMKKSIAKA